ncbi:MAG TPA: amidohydrolase [Steroidobacteraceae bacterium]|jgi:imidazolonepropionase-like amidohydrolase
MKLLPRAAVLALSALSTVTFAASDPFPSTYKPAPSTPVLIRGATLLTGTGERLEGADLIMSGGHITQVGKNLTAPDGARVIDGKNLWVTPGLIDIHSHLGVYPSPATEGNSDGNEMTNPVTANVWAEHSVWPQDPGFEMALEGGITTLQILPGSGNLIGGRSVVLKNVHADTTEAMKFPSAPYGLKMACGENPKRVYGSKGAFPMTRMGDVAGYRQAFADAQEYQQQLDKYQRDLAAYEKKKTGHSDSDKKSKDKDKEDKDSDKDAPPTPPKRDLKLETLAGVLRGEIRVHMHCYRADEMTTMLDVADEFNFKIAAFHHAVEAYKIADHLAERGVCAAMWADWWGFKMEAYDGIQENLPLVDYPKNSCAIVHSDSEAGIQRLNQEAAKSMAHAARVGLVVPPERAIRWLTINPAKSLGLDDKIGSLEVGKNADVVVWNSTPFSVYALAEEVFIDGALVFDRAHPPEHPPSDFLLGQSSSEVKP